MSVPGLQLAEVPDEVDSKIINIERGREWRFEVAHDQSIRVKLTRGTAEIFGTELSTGNQYTFTGCKSAIYTWSGCTLEITGTPQVEYTSEETPMSVYTNLHFALEKRRGQASESNLQGPRVIIIGPEDAGKTSLTKLLTGYAVRQGRRPVVINLDPKEGMLSLPGTLTATTFTTIMDVEEGWGTSPTSGPSPVPAKLPLVYYYGLEKSEEHDKLYRKLTARMALAVSSKLSDAEDDQMRASGYIIDTSGHIASTASGSDIIAHIIAEFGVDTLVVLGSERLYSDMTKRFEERMQNPVTVVKVEKSGGCVDRNADEDFLRKTRETAVREYFFGEPKRTLSPYIMTASFDEVAIFSVGQMSGVGAELLPAGEIITQPLYVRVEPSNQLQHAVLAVLHADIHDNESTLAESTIMGFVYVSSVDEVKRTLKFLAPVSGRLPRRPMIVGPWPERVPNM